MKELEKDELIIKILKEGLLEKAPTGMVDRIMANVAVSPARRTSITAIEPNPLVAVLLPIIIALLVLVAAVLKVKSRFSFSLDQYLNLTINPIWIAPVVVFALTVWGYIIISKYIESSKNRMY